nr:MAG TPA: hypothetical protein [Caudoviricetes sp.]DAW86841.1 MAG TPA: hypothetical protein [Caudoviricetes sp.]
MHIRFITCSDSERITAYGFIVSPLTYNTILTHQNR